MTTPERLFGLPLDEIMRRTAEKTPYAGGGAVSALACASAAALVVMAARFAGEPAEPVLADIEPLIHELGDLADADAEAFAALLAAWKLPTDDPGRRTAVAAGARKACEVPLRVCELGARIVEGAEFLVTNGKPDLEGDAMTAAYLADAAVQSAARLVQLNARQAAETSLGAQAADHAAQTRGIVANLEKRPD